LSSDANEAYGPTRANPFTDVSTGSGDNNLDRTDRLILLQTTHVCFGPDFVRLPLKSRRGSGRSRESVVDPTETFAAAASVGSWVVRSTSRSPASPRLRPSGNAWHKGKVARWLAMCHDLGPDANS